AAVGHASWATCPITENGFIRVVSNPAYRTVATTPEDAAQRLRQFCSQPGHVFWDDAVSLLDDLIFDLSKLKGHQQITDAYLAGLAHHFGGPLATFDSSIPVAAIRGAGASIVELIPA